MQAGVVAQRPEASSSGPVKLNPAIWSSQICVLVQVYVVFLVTGLPFSAAARSGIIYVFPKRFATISLLLNKAKEIQRARLAVFFVVHDYGYCNTVTVTKIAAATRALYHTSRETRGLSRLVIPAVVAYVVCMYRVRARLFAHVTQNHY